MFAVKRVVTFAAVDGVVAATAVGDIVAALGLDRVAALGAEQQVLPVRAVDRLARRRLRIGIKVPDELDLAQVLAVHMFELRQHLLVEFASEIDQIVDGVALGVGGLDERDVVPADVVGQADDVVDDDEVLDDVGGPVRVRLDDKDVLPVATREGVRSLAAVEPVVAAVAFELVVAAPAVELVVAGIAAEKVAPPAAEHRVVAVMAHHEIVAFVAMQRVVAGAAVHPVVALGAAKGVVAAEAPDFVMAGGAGQRVGAERAVEIGAEHQVRVREGDPSLDVVDHLLWIRAETIVRHVHLGQHFWWTGAVIKNDAERLFAIGPCTRAEMHHFQVFRLPTVRTAMEAGDHESVLAHHIILDEDVGLLIQDKEIAVAAAGEGIVLALGTARSDHVAKGILHPIAGVAPGDQPVVAFAAVEPVVERAAQTALQDIVPAAAVQDNLLVASLACGEKVVALATVRLDAAAGVHEPVMARAALEQVKALAADGVHRLGPCISVAVERVWVEAVVAGVGRAVDDAAVGQLMFRICGFRCWRFDHFDHSST